jgi:hypothetical protein
MYARGRIAAALAIAGCWAVTLSAQWPEVRTKGPQTASGALNLTAPAPKLADGKTPDLSGIWDADKFPCTEAIAALGCIDAPQGIPFGAINIGGGTAEVLPMQPWAEALVKQRKENGSRDDSIARCLPITPARAWASFTLQKIIQTRDTLVVLDEYMLQYRQIFLDARPLPKDPEPTFKGYSVGKWDGDTLVVETVGLKDNAMLDMWGHPLTDQARITERIRRVNYGHLQIDLTVNDPKAYTKPWTATIKLTLAPNTELLEYVCNENEKSLQHMVGADAGK